ncbi:MAG: hypothetical protein HYW48_09230 [Deltaproteobacteria bacterium]|nr:hypothetical protein [Deltaproteobacteria bacterium]
MYLFNFALNVCRKKAAEIAQHLETTSAHISQIRRGKGTGSKQFWKFFKVVFLSLLSEKRNRTIDKVISEPYEDAAA